ncbi:MAG: flavodoxin [Enterococcus lacertideformus]|uniref:Flavodoxin n=1 Tax=Enterococcus lacertideformus TaxID=2771493 RepID=A0A931F9W8_9ENTE|nr:flavodoxin [Enterococcus lacertideformus]
MNPVVVYFSRDGENFINGISKKIPIGNTEVLAHKIVSRLNCSLIKLKEVESYPDNYDETVKRTESAKKEDMWVDYQKIELDRSKIDTLFLGYPNWWGSYPRIIATFLEEFDTDGLIIYSFRTHEDSSFGSSLNELKNQCTDADIRSGLPVRGSRVGRADVAIENWLLAYK